MENQDDCITDLFAFLHKQNPITNTYLQIHVPDTIAYKNSIPRAWYFSDRNGQVKMKSKAKLEDSYVKDYFLLTKSDIVAQWITFNGNQQTHIEYFDRESFGSFLSRPEPRQGIIQKFIYPKGQYNHTIRCLWTPQQCIFEKFQSKFNIYDKKNDFYQRILTYERDLTLAQPLISKLIHERIENFCSSLVDHIRDLLCMRANVQQMILYFRQDDGDRIWQIKLFSFLRLLGCQSIKFKENIRQNAKCRFDNTNISLSPRIDDHRLLFSKSQTVLKEGICQKCNLWFHENDLLQMKLKQIIESWGFNHQGNVEQREKLDEVSKKIIIKQTILERLKGYERQNKNRYSEEATIRLVNPNYLIPDLIRKLFPQLKYEDYRYYLSHSGFTDLECTVCYDCHIEIDKGVNVEQDLSKLAQVEKVRKSFIKGTQDLRPHILNKRFAITRKEILNKISNSTLKSSRQESTIPQSLNAQPIRLIQNEQGLMQKIIGISPTNLSFKQLGKRSEITPLKKDNYSGMATARQTTPSSRKKFIAHSRNLSDLK